MLYNRKLHAKLTDEPINGRIKVQITEWNKKRQYHVWTNIQYRCTAIKNEHLYMCTPNALFPPFQNTRSIDIYAFDRWWYVCWWSLNFRFIQIYLFRPQKSIAILPCHFRAWLFPYFVFVAIHVHLSTYSLPLSVQINERAHRCSDSEKRSKSQLPRWNMKLLANTQKM